MKFTKEMEENLAKLMKDYNASDLGELVDILPDLVLEDGYEDENELPHPQEGVDLAKDSLTYKESDTSCPFSFVPYPFN